ncbi:MAG: hypothetical protein ACHP9T_14650 [Caulobacterales bacterium]|jgi:hypothetical protein
MKPPPAALPPPPPRVRLSLGVTGHRQTNAAFRANRAAIEATLATIFDALDVALAATPAVVGLEPPAPPRLHSMLVDGVDQLAAAQAVDRGWELVAPLPFGRALNTAINAHPETADEARFLMSGVGACGPATRARAASILALEGQARLFELADRDEAIAALYLARLEAPDDIAKAQAYAFEASERVALAARVMIEQSDLIVGVWDGVNTSFVGGTGHTIALALEMGAPVVWIDAGAPHQWRILRAPESLATISPDAPADPGRGAALDQLVRGALRPTAGKKADADHDSMEGLRALRAERWRPRSNPVWHAYRRIEALFGAEHLRGRFRGLTQVYEAPDAVAAGSAAGQLAAADALPGQEARFVTRIRDEILRRFAWADGVSARLSDVYRGGMILNFLFSAFAIVGGVAYLPLATSHEKWLFAVFELALLVAILAITLVGQKRRWHRRWFETRRVAEYFRHALILLVLGVARPTGRWPRGAETSWPEWYARHALRDVGLPRLKVTAAYLRGAVANLLLDHVVRQRDYHRYKANRLARTHHQLDRLSEALFVLAVLSVSGYLALRAGGALHLLSDALAARLSRWFTFLGVLLPTFGAGLAGIRYFGDFERFSAISEVTAEKLDAVAGRIELLLKAPDGALDYARASELAHAADDIVVSEIENWQAVFGGKHITVPV